MRSHVTKRRQMFIEAIYKFQYRKRYEVTCDVVKLDLPRDVTRVSIPQAV